MSESKASPISLETSSSGMSSETFYNETESGFHLHGSKSGRKNFVRSKSIDLNDSFDLYKSIDNTPRSGSSTHSKANVDRDMAGEQIKNNICNSNLIEQFNHNDIFKIEAEQNLLSNNNGIVDMVKQAKINTGKEKSTHLELKLLPLPQQKFDINRTKENLESGERTTSLPLTPSDGIFPPTPSTAPPLYSSVFANVGKCVMMPIDKQYETKYLLMNKMNGINGVNSYIPPGMRVKTEKTVQERVYLFLEHPSGWLCFFYHMFV